MEVGAGQGKPRPPLGRQQCWGSLWHTHRGGQDTPYTQSQQAAASRGVSSSSRNRVISVPGERSFSESYERRCDRHKRGFRSKRTAGLSKRPLCKWKQKPTGPQRRARLVLPGLFLLQYPSLDAGLLLSCRVFAHTFTRLQTRAATNAFISKALKFLTKTPGPLGRPLSSSSEVSPCLPTGVSR